MNPVYLQAGCLEKDALDLTQANAVVEFKPDIILFEYPNNHETPDMVFNAYGVDEKPLDEIQALKENIREVIDIHPWVESDLVLYDNVVRSWQEGRDILLYRIDGPSELTSLSVSKPGEHDPQPKDKGDDFCWWVRQYIREHIMTRNLTYVLSKCTLPNPRILACLEAFHWEHIQFLMKDPGSEEIKDYYFAEFEVGDQEAFEEKLKNCHPLVLHYWQKEKICS